MMTFEDLKQKIIENDRQVDLDKLTEVYQLAEKAHEGQKRVSGEPYITHPLEVTSILVDLGMDTDTLAAALLHDVVEDTDVPLETIAKKFGSDVASMVDGVTKLGKVPFHSREEQQAENVRKMLLAMANDVRVVIIKLADRLHNMRTMACMRDEKRRQKSLETMEVYAPLAHRLGIRAIKEELEDLSLRYLDPVAYEEIEQQLAKRHEDRVSFLEHIKTKIRDRICADHPHMVLEGRIKSVYGIYRKVYMQGRNFDEIYDVYAVRVIVDTVNECYNVLGEIHDMFRPLPNRFKDYISTPKANMYQSLHTTVLDPETEAIPFEVQIRTFDMHHTAEYGIAAHWKYKAGIAGKDKLEDRLAWVRQLLESQKESGDAQDIIRSIKSDIAPEEVFVFTPKGDVLSLPAGSTVIDFAYAIHSEVGNRTVGAKIDGRIVSLDTKVATGQIVEIITTNAPGHGPSRDWLKVVRTNGARTKIRTWFKKERREENIQQGMEELEAEFRRNNIQLEEDQRDPFILDIAKRYYFNTLDDFYAAIGYGGVQVSKIIPKVKEEYVKRFKQTNEQRMEKAITNSQSGQQGKKKESSSGVVVEGLDSCLVKFARCCNPLPGDEIVGFVTRGFGVSIHKKDCQNYQNAKNDPEQAARWVNAWWNTHADGVFKSTVEIVAHDRPGMLADVSIEISNMRIPIHSLIARAIKDNCVDINITVGVSDINQLNYMLGNLKKIKGVISIDRTFN